jgi:hypothetical protein
MLGDKRHYSILLFLKYNFTLRNQQKQLKNRLIIFYFVNNIKNIKIKIEYK